MIQKSSGNDDGVNNGSIEVDLWACGKLNRGRRFDTDQRAIDLFRNSIG